ncbi:hypothetical protein CUPL110328_04235 [Cupriavidus plantarum]|nr:hypothetical protein LMG26296_03332 [Cupriavidus plantarum]SMR65626.1 hypothetical protein SAMN05421735_0476 [Cupriavidus plantarum]
MTGALVALFYVLIAMLGGISAFVFILAFRGRVS